MLLGRSLEFNTSEPAASVLGRLAAVVLPTGAIAPLELVRVDDWIGQQAGKRFIGRVEGSSFKLGLLPTQGARFRVRGSLVVIVGKVEGRCARIVLRLPRFISAFLIVFALTVSAALAFSFFGPLAGHPIQAVLALALILPFAVVGGFFRREALRAEQTLRQVLLGS